MRLVNLMPLNEIDFPNQRAFDEYNKIHKLRPDTEVTVAGRKTTAGRASQNSKPLGGSNVFGNDDDEMHPRLKALYKQRFGKEEPTNNGDETPQKLVFPDAKKKDATSKEPFDGGSNVLDRVTDLLPVGSGFRHKKTGNEILVKGYKDNHMIVSYEKYPNKLLKWPLKQFLKMTKNKELQFHPKSK